jgi:DNA-nicking Smr family endonuclease
MAQGPNRSNGKLDLSGLAGLRDTLKAQHAARETARAQAEARAKQAEEEANLFRRSLGPVTPLLEHDRVDPERARPSAHPVQTRQDEQAVLRASLSDEFDVDSLLDTDDTLSFRRPGIGPDVVRKLRRGHWVVQRQIDLHGLRRDEAREALAEFLRQSVRQGLRCVRIIHGKGLGSPGREPVLKGKVRTWLVQKEEVIAFAEPRAVDGGGGVLVVLLQPSS